MPTKMRMPTSRESYAFGLCLTGSLIFANCIHVVGWEWKWAFLLSHARTPGLSSRRFIVLVLAAQPRRQDVGQRLSASYSVNCKKSCIYKNEMFPHWDEVCRLNLASIVSRLLLNLS
jgi:hypothetical protein